MDILLRMKKLIEAKGYKNKPFAEKIGIAPTTLDTYFKKNRYPAYETIYGILHTFPDISAEWLMRGEGSMYITDELPVIRGDETEDEENLHVMVAQYRVKLKEIQEENMKLMGQLEFMEEFNLKVSGKLNKANEELEKLRGEKSKKDII